MTIPHQILFAAAALSALAGATTRAGDPGLQEIQVFLSRHCYACHDEDSAKGDLNLFDLRFTPGDHENFATWEHVFERVVSGEMPPAKKPRPEEAEKREFLKAIGDPLMAADRERKLKDGRVHVRRLTRREYEYTVHDLLGVDLPLRQLLPEDPVSHGFETVAAGQQLSHHHLARYLETADRALTEAFDRAIKGDRSFEKAYAPKELNRGHGRGNYRGPELRDGRSIAWPIRQQFYGRLPATRIPADGWYRITLEDLRAVNPKHGVVWGTLKSGVCYSHAPLMHPIGIVEATAKARDQVYTAWIREGHILELKPNDATLRRAPNNARGGTVSYKGVDHAKKGFSGISIRGIRIERIYPNATRAEVRRNLFGELTRDDLDAAETPEETAALLHQAIRTFAARAFRRPVSDEQLAGYFELAESLLDEPGGRPVDALRAAYRAVLCAPRFLTLVEKPGPLDDHAIASRLSYALWNSMPDRELRELADRGGLRDTRAFHAQIRRLLDDPRSERFIAAFTDQWLNLREIDFTSPDRRMFRDWDDIVQASMVAETRAFVRDMIRRDLSVQNLVHSNFAIVNERLARHYGLDSEELQPGRGLQKVALDDLKRGGLITQGAVLKVTANGTTTSPVIRGVWVNERILGRHIPPPPPNVPAVEPDIRGAVSIRDQLDKHRADPSCAGCHRKIDPAGFALEHFDPVGVARTKYGKGKNAAGVDTSGMTPDGESFAGLVEWKKIYVKRPEMLTRAFATQLLTYATGAPPRFSDRTALLRIIEAARERDYGARSILHAALASDVFLIK